MIRLLPILLENLGLSLAVLAALLVFVIWRTYRWINPERPRPEIVYSLHFDRRSLKLCLGGLGMAGALIFLSGVSVGLRLSLPPPWPQTLPSSTR